jgi:hypothetical protein
LSVFSSPTLSLSLFLSLFFRCFCRAASLTSRVHLSGIYTG